MAKIYGLKCDLTAEISDSVRNYEVAVNGVTYEIDLTPDAYGKITLKQIVELGRKVGKLTSVKGGRKASRATASAEDKARTANIRQWVREVLRESISDQGRPAAKYLEAWMEAGQPTAPFEKPKPEKKAAPRKKAASRASQKAVEASEPVEGAAAPAELFMEPVAV